MEHRPGKITQIKSIQIKLSGNWPISAKLDAIITNLKMGYIFAIMLPHPEYHDAMQNEIKGLLADFFKRLKSG